MRISSEDIYHKLSKIRNTISLMKHVHTVVFSYFTEAADLYTKIRRSNPINRLFISVSQRYTQRKSARNNMGGLMLDSFIIPAITAE